MAGSLDNFSDLQELGIDLNESTENLTALFSKAANHLQKLVPSLDNKVLLTLYGYYKQGTEGVCSASKPSWYDLRAKSKWEAWNKLGDMSQDDAKKMYIETLKQIDPSFDIDSKEKPSEHWVKVSSMVKTDTSSSQLNIIDYIREGNIKEIENFLKNHTPDIKNDGLALIHWAADDGNIEILKKLIESGANINILDNEGQTALHYAASCGHTECVKVLLQGGADKNLSDSEGNTPFDVASDTEIQDLLR